MPASSPGTAVAVPDKRQLELAYKAVIDGEPLPVANDPELMSRMILERIMAAETFEEAFQPQKIPAWRDAMLDTPVKITDIHFNPSTIEGAGASIYAVIDLVDVKSGEAATVTCGGRNVLVQLIKMLEKGWTENVVRLTTKKTSEGYSVLWLEAA